MFVPAKEALAAIAIPLRRALHQCAEPAFHEWQTLDFIVNCLKDLPLELKFLPAALGAQYGVSQTHKILGHAVTIPGLMASLHLKPVGKHVALRCDMDALPIVESRALDHLPTREHFSSQTACMHACGHDGHMAIALTILQILCHNVDLLRATKHDLATISFIFQGAEEGCAGAQVWLQTPYLDDIDELYCLHLGMGLAQGYFASRVEHFLATRKFDVHVQGKKAHAGRPQEGVHALRALCHLIDRAMALQDPKATRLINFGTLTCLGARNIVPDEACAQGEIRALSRNELTTLTQGLEQAIKATEHYVPGCQIKLNYRGWGLTIDGSKSLEAALNQAALDSGLQLSPHFAFQASEDASLLIDYVQAHGGQGIYSVCGSTLAAGHHQVNFDFNEKTLADAAQVYLYLLARRLGLN